MALQQSIHAKQTATDTIAAIATPLNASGLGIVRLSGPACLGIMRQVFRPAGTEPHKKIRSHIATPGMIRTAHHVLDQAMALYMKAPKSFTGEDMVEFTTHGSPLVLKNILSLLIERGARIAEPGEFTKRAYLNGKMDLAQAEAVAELIRAKTDAAARTAVEQLTGNLSREIKILKNTLIEIKVQLEVRLDYPEEDIDAYHLDSVIQQCDALAHTLRNLITSSVRGYALSQGVRCAIIGKPNVGKSSLLNALLQTDRAIVTDEPGTTRDVIDAEFVLHDTVVRIVDTAGIRSHAFSRAEHLGIERSRKATHDADLILAVFDQSMPVTDDDRMVLNCVEQKPWIGVLNKSDTAHPVHAHELADLLSNASVVPISALTNDGIDRLREAIGQILTINLPPIESSVIITNVRHETVLKRALRSVERATQSARERKSEECIVFEINEALTAFDEITGATTNEDILERIFAEFCIGK
ncbi:MAG: tRNA uridine-5-carboxymethylaminomethyl(34) synthesis GTPase MnmE [Elusimicrobia bacterium]|nr:tRNA uridine-5-carboxymethylaminomethyl(34) synthesis GTPase MnmE [Elusimicrobiota bacterium]MBD3411888.1 tRNA uridine-5-carboxymethylaminomethyl(34) synthesis GTPase MnmE [Elusimicrobiota bacterium]